MWKLLGLILFWLFVSGFLKAQSPNIASVSIADGTVDAIVGISGSNFSTNTADLVVSFGGMEGTVLQATENFIEVAVPAGATTSAISVTNIITGLTGYSTDIFNLNYSGTGIYDVSSQEISRFDSFEEIFDLTISDFDKDGLNDVATSKIGTSSGDILLFKNTSVANTINFTLLNKITNPEFDIKNPTSNITSGDIDGDGKPDLVATRSLPTANQIYVWRNTSIPGTISFDNQKPFFIKAGEIAKAIKIRDLDGDGKPELIVTNNETNTILLFQNTSTKGNVNFGTTPITLEIPGLSSTNGLSVEDLNDDGKPEIITNPLFETNVIILENLSTKSNFIFGDPLVLNLGGSLNSLVVGDINRDGKSDIAITKTQENKIAFFINNSTENINFESPVEFDTGLRPWGLDLGDLNGDGKLDVAVTSINSDEATIFENSSTESIIDFNVKVVSQEFRTRNIKIGDLSGDGKPDIVTTAFDFVTNQYRLITVRNTNCFQPTILNAPESICSGQIIRLDVSPGLFVNYIWKRDGIEIKNSTDRFVDITLPGTYTVTAESEGGSCSEVNSNTVRLGTGGIPPDIGNTVTNDGPACIGASVNLSIQPVAGATYSWTGPNDFISSDQSPVLSNVKPEMAGNYFATVAIGDCKSPPAATLVEVLVPPDFTIQASGPTRFCQGQNVLLSVNTETGFTYQWLKDNVLISDATLPGITVTEDGDYSVIVSSSTISCNIDTEIVSVTTFLPPEVAFTFSGVQCANNEIQFLDQSSLLSEFTPKYVWNFDDGSPNSTDISPVHSFTTAGDYNVQLTIDYEGQNCNETAVQTVSISESTPFTITVTGNTEFCQGSSTTLSAPDTFASYEWSTGETTSEIIVEESAIYMVTATNSAGCPFTDQIDITVFDLPLVTITPDSVIIQQGDTAQLVATGALTYVWSPGESLSDSTISNPIASPLATILYTVVGTDINGCLGEGNALVTVDTQGGKLPVTAPKLFSPNGDSIDDVWVIENVENFPQCQLVIFARSGLSVFEAQPYNNDWNGVYNGEELPEGAYYYVISCPDGRSSTGSISIIR
jgi:gliding motility-associated-like protein